MFESCPFLRMMPTAESSFGQSLQQTGVVGAEEEYHKDSYGFHFLIGVVPNSPRPAGFFKRSTGAKSLKVSLMFESCPFLRMMPTAESSFGQSLQQTGVVGAEEEYHKDSMGRLYDIEVIPQDRCKNKMSWKTKSCP